MHCKQFKCHSTYSQLDSALTLLPLFISCIMQLMRWGSNGGKGTGGGQNFEWGSCPCPPPLDQTCVEIWNRQGFRVRALTLFFCVLVCWNCMVFTYVQCTRQ